MANSLHLGQQNFAITEQHIQRLQDHAMSVAGVGVCEEVISSLYRLVALCTCPPNTVSFTSYQEASNCKETIESFLKIVNNNTDDEFAEMYLTQILAQVQAWSIIVGQQYQISTGEVWELLSPVEPDTLYNLNNGVFEAKWWPPVPQMDVEILRRTAGITILSEFCETQPKGIFSVRFSIMRT